MSKRKNKRKRERNSEMTKRKKKRKKERNSEMTKRKKNRKELKNEQRQYETNLKKKRITLQMEPKMKHNVIRVVL